MSRGQIEEMARDICECFNNDGTCYQDDKLCDCKCDSFTDAQYLYEKGYRKQEWISVEEIDKIFNDYKLSERGLQLIQHREPSIDQRYAELKKKYTEGKE